MILPGRIHEARQRFGVEEEVGLQDRKIDDVLNLKIPDGSPEGRGITGLTEEFFDQTAEIITPDYEDPEDCITFLKIARQDFDKLGVRLSAYAHQINSPAVTLETITSRCDYYRWVLQSGWKIYGAPSPDVFKFLSYHIHASDERFADKDFLLFANAYVNCHNAIFIGLTANSNTINVKSKRIWEFPHLDVPFFPTGNQFVQLIEQLKKTGHVYKSKDRFWTTSCIPRFENGELHRLELRSLDAGTKVSYEVVLGCIRLLGRLIDQAWELYTSSKQLPVFSAGSARLNDMQAARLGMQATIIYNGAAISLMKLAKDLSQGIPELQRHLEKQETILLRHTPSHGILAFNQKSPSSDELPTRA